VNVSEKNRDPLTTNIADSLIEEAVRSVEKRQRHEEPAREPAPEPDAEPAAAASGPAEGGAAVGGEPGGDEVARLKAELLEARQSLRQREAELELSQSMARKTQETLKENHERLLRATADLENYKKRVAREKEEANRFGQEKLLRDILPVLDNLDRALEHQGPSDLDSLRAGVAMTRRLLEQVLGKYGVKGFSAKGATFDPRLHEAMQSVESDEPAGTVVQELVRGFMLHDRLMRPAMVVVAKAKAPPTGTEEKREPAEKPAPAEAEEKREPAEKPAPAEAEEKREPAEKAAPKDGRGRRVPKRRGASRAETG
jgi:molecular chaperone GrpE